MSNILSELKQTTLSIYDENDKVISNCFVITFNVDREKKSIRPFLIFSNNTSFNDECYISLPIVDENGKAKTIKKKIYFGMLCKEFLLSDFNVVAVPFAFVYNDLFQKKLNIGFKTIQEELFLDDESRNKVSPFENLSFFAYNNVLNDSAYYNARPFSSIKDKKPFFIDCPRPKIMGFPIFVFNETAYVENNSVNLGSRLFLAGIATTSNDGLLMIEPIDLIAKKIKTKFDFLSSKKE